MLRFAQSSSASPANHMDLSVLERQRAQLQRLYQHQQSWHNQEMDCFDLLSVVSNSNDSSRTKAVVPKPDQQCNSSLPSREANNVSSSLKKRKAEFDVEEDGKEKGVLAEEEKSEITMKTERENSSNTCSKVSEVQKPDYIHVRARRGQATDSHSLAERFLSMKLAAINPRLDFSIDNIFAKEQLQQLSGWESDWPSSLFNAGFH
ncbi:UNVERIFIED_CONTAM: Transcription factor [Sesamum angustifolium]|uniref:Transcription factor n=1 Tax=Sesamum angustifolium TaxID=2727405 RepID=A0AAW2NIM2_9LAMI